MKKKHPPSDAIKAFKKANRDLQFERNGGGQWVATDKPHKSKKAYDRKRYKKKHY